MQMTMMRTMNDNGLYLWSTWNMVDSNVWRLGLMYYGFKEGNEDTQTTFTERVSSRIRAGISPRFDSSLALNSTKCLT